MNSGKYTNVLGCVVTYKPFYENMLFNELHQRCDSIKLIQRGDGSSVFEVQDYNQIVSEINKTDFVFLQHIHPFMCKCKLTGCISDFTEFLKMAEVIQQYITHDDKIICQCRIVAEHLMDYSNGELNNLLSSFIEKNSYSLSVENADTAISLTVFDDFAYMGVSCLIDNVSERAGGKLFYAKNDNVICRAEFKIEEAFKVFDINVTNDMIALDLGASPGGWTHFLSQRGISVDAVDPADLNEIVLKQPNVKHYKMLAQQYIENNIGNTYDIIVNDMKMDTNESIDIVCSMLNNLKKDGICILTLKLPKKGVQKKIKIAQSVLGSKFEIIRIKQLYYNRSEVTLFAKNKIV